jgi:hypothetical protein
MAPPLHGDKDERINIRINDAATANSIHKAAVTRDYIKQPRLSRKQIKRNFYLI